ncbi:hypothetical protein [Sulfobacillus harzensis]|uniref:Uncharacterized protein n=1 Tax=Sulfobacillus harzensis TaxID=2729629 RepID=A0A7Y0L4X1_9FIRM|nr:hypothetical protein [Sulfobacillus harzensis]NMP23275.1 hypothetical protein [Sulfobacillus harzensis]
MVWLRALFRAVVVALAIWAGQSLVPSSNRAGIWAMVSLGIGCAVLGVILVKAVWTADGRMARAGLQFLATAVILEVFYWLLPKTIGMGVSDFVLALAIGIVSGLSEWVAPDVPMREEHPPH